MGEQQIPGRWGNGGCPGQTTGFTRQREAQRSLPRLRASEEHPAVVRAPDTGWGWLARDKDADKGRQVMEGPKGHTEEHEVRKGGAGLSTL